MAKYKSLYIGLIFCLTLPVLSSAQGKLAFERGSFILKKDTLAYRILFPLNFDPSKKYPLVLVLHGAGERGNDNEAQLKYGTDLFLRDTIRKKYAAIVIFPQCLTKDFWSNVKINQDSVTKKNTFNFQEEAPPTKAMQLLMGLVANFIDKPFVNAHKIYVGGLSMGGMGTFEIIGREPAVFAAAFAICGGDNTANAKKYAKKVPLWIFHGQKDSVVPFTHSEVVVAAIKQAGGDPKFTVYPNDDHNSWDDAFAEPMLIPWLFSHRK
jgi:predicted peptidase